MRPRAARATGGEDERLERAPQLVQGAVEPCSAARRKHSIAEDRRRQGQAEGPARNSELGERSHLPSSPDPQRSISR
jgi:hypothetical protein